MRFGKYYLTHTQSEFSGALGPVEFQLGSLPNKTLSPHSSWHNFSPIGPSYVTPSLSLYIQLMPGDHWGGCSWPGLAGLGGNLPGVFVYLLHVTCSYEKYAVWFHLPIRTGLSKRGVLLLSFSSLFLRTGCGGLTKNFAVKYFMYSSQVHRPTPILTWPWDMPQAGLWLLALS